MRHSPTHPRLPPGQVLIELRRVGYAVKISAVHVDTGVEVCVMGPAGAGEAVLKAAVLNKLAYVLACRAGESAAGPPPAGGARPLRI
jgi:hypothetical protein